MIKFSYHCAEDLKTCLILSVPILEPLLFLLYNRYGSTVRKVENNR